MLAHIARQCISMVKAHYWYITCTDCSSPANHGKTWQDILTLDKGTIRDLIWWRDAVSCWNGCPIQQAPVDIQMEMDVRSLGWQAEVVAESPWHLEHTSEPKILKLLRTANSAVVSVITHKLFWGESTTDTYYRYDPKT